MKTVKFNELKNFIYEIYGLTDINEDTCINYEKTISEDNDKFINLLKQNYYVNMDNFKYYDYFEEDEFILLSVFRSLLFYLGILKKRKKKLKLGHILAVINNGKWFDPENEKEVLT